MAEAKSTKLYKVVIDAVLRDIGAGRFSIGSRLPTERDLSEANGVSRTTVREAMVALEMLGIVQMRRGSGIYVASARPAPEHATDLDIGAFELIEARRTIEAEVAALAARYITPAQIQRLEGSIDGMADPDEERGELADRDFHIAIAEASGNGAMVAVVAYLWDMRERAPLARTILHRARGPGLRQRIVEHREIVETLRRGDQTAARDAMRRHLDRVIEHLLVMTENDDIAAARKRSAERRERLDPAR